MHELPRLAHVALGLGLVIACLPQLAGAQCTNNTAYGTNALASVTTGCQDTAFGYWALQADTTGSYNTAVGLYALRDNQIGGSNTAVGYQALRTNSSNANTAVGMSALRFNTTGQSNVGVGSGTLEGNNTGNYNTAVGMSALISNDDGNANTAVGYQALFFNYANYNTAVGYQALYSNTANAANSAVGFGALYNSTGTNNTALGFWAGINLTSGDNNIDISNVGVAGESNTIRIGNVGTQTATYIAGISGATSSGGTAVYVNSNGQLGTATSSARFKDDIRDMGDSSSGLMNLRPVRFRYKKEIDSSGLEQYGLVAEEVAKVYPGLVVYDDKGRPQSVRYHFVNAMLLNEVQKQAHHSDAQDRIIRAQAKKIEALTDQVRQANARAEQIEALAARLVRLEAAANVQGRDSVVQAAYRPEPSR